MASNRNRKRGNPFARVAEMWSGDLGREDYAGWGKVRVWFDNLFKHKTTIDQSKSSYGLFRALYHGRPDPNIQVHESMFLGAAFAKPIINSTMAFALGAGFTITLAGSDENEAIKAAENDLNAVRRREFARIYKWLKLGTRDGDGFLFINELGELNILKPETVDVVTNPLDGHLLGYNVTEHVEETDPTTGTKTKWVYLKQYRESWVRVTKMLENQTQEQGTIVYERIFINGEDIDTQAKDEAGEPINIEATEDEIDKRRLPIIHYRNEYEPGALYGFSELQNVLHFMRNYGEALDGASKRENYNGKPVLALHGITDPTKDPQNKNATKKTEDGEDVLDWQQEIVMYFEDANSKASFLEIPNSMDNTGKLLEYLFYNIVQASETPEFLFGTAVQSSRASVSEQMPVVAQKAERKRAEMLDSLTDFVKLYVNRQIENSNPIYYPLAGAELELTIDFPSIIDEDKKIVLETIELMLAEGVIDRKTALTLSVVAERINDPDRAVADGMNDLLARNNANNSYPEQPDRLTDELNADDDLGDELGG